MSKKLPVVLLALILFSPAAACADDYVITLKDNKFSPPELTIPAGQKVKVTVKNQGNSTAEFESSDFNREKIVGANSEITVFIGPLDPGKYGYFDDFHRETTGTILVK